MCYACCFRIIYLLLMATRAVTGISGDIIANCLTLVNELPSRVPAPAGPLWARTLCAGMLAQLKRSFPDLYHHKTHQPLHNKYCKYAYKLLVHEYELYYFSTRTIKTFNLNTHGQQGQSSKSYTHDEPIKNKNNYFLCSLLFV